MKLELEHLTPYLPYGIQVTYVQRLFGGEKIVKHHNQSIDRIFMDYGFINLHTEPYSKQAPLNDYLLELRPLSDLTKEIEVNGEKFVPMKKILKEVGLNYPQECYNQDEAWVLNDGYRALGEFSYRKIQLLFEWHF